LLSVLNKTYLISIPVILLMQMASRKGKAIASRP